MANARKMGENGSQGPSDDIRVHYPEFKSLLLARREELVGREKVARSNLDEQVASGPGDVADESVLDTSADYFLNLANSQSRELVEIQNALEKMQQGTYGACESCDEPIAVERLKRLPYARLCVDCQGAAEKHFRVSKISPYPKL